MGRQSERTAGVRPASSSSIEIRFTYRGVKCYERIKLRPTLANLEKCRELRADILEAIGADRFDYRATFPNSKTAQRIGDVTSHVVTVADGLDRWLERIRPFVQRSTYNDYRKSCDQLKHGLGALYVSELRPYHVRDWVATKPTVTNKRIANLLIPLRGMFEEMLEDETIEANPIANWRPRRRIQQRFDPERTDYVDPFDLEEIRLILAELPDQARNMAQFAIWTGLRTSELLAATWGQIDWNRSTFLVDRAMVRAQVKPPKTAAGRRLVKLLAPALEALERQKAHTYLAGDVIFHNPRSGEPWVDDRAFRRGAWMPALRRAKVRYRYPYQTRHTYASLMLSAGEPPAWLAGQMGHTDWGLIRKRYARWIPGIDPQAGERAEALWQVDPVILERTRPKGNGTDGEAD